MADDTQPAAKEDKLHKVVKTLVALKEATAITLEHGERCSTIGHVARE